MPVIKVREKRAVRRSSASLQAFLRKKAGVLAEVRRREFYEKNRLPNVSALKASAVKRHAKKLARENARRTRLY